METSITPYVFFTGCAAQAFATYGALFGVEPTVTRYEDLPQDEGGADFEGSDRVLLGSIRLPSGALLMGGDYAPGLEQSIVRGMAVTLTLEDPVEAFEYFTALSENGTVMWPWARTYWAPGFGVLTDEFGCIWMIWARTDENGAQPPPMHPNLWSKSGA